jgi:hypothetical protein
MRSKKIEEAGMRWVNAQEVNSPLGASIAFQKMKAALALPEDTEQSLVGTWQELESELEDLDRFAVNRSSGGRSDYWIGRSHSYKFVLQSLRDLRPKSNPQSSESSPEKKYGVLAGDHWICYCKYEEVNPLNCDHCEDCGCLRPPLTEPEKKYGRWSENPWFWICSCDGYRERDKGIDWCDDCDHYRPLPTEQGESKLEITIGDVLTIIKQDNVFVNDRLFGIEQRLSAIEATAGQVAEAQPVNTSCACRETTGVDEDEASAVSQKFRGVYDGLAGEPEGKELVSTVPDPGEGYRLLNPITEVLRDGDEFYDSGKWWPEHAAIGKTAYSAWVVDAGMSLRHYRRRISEPTEVPQVWEGFQGEDGIMILDDTHPPIGSKVQITLTKEGTDNA